MRTSVSFSLKDQIMENTNKAILKYKLVLINSLRGYEMVKVYTRIIFRIRSRNVIGRQKKIN